MAAPLKLHTACSTQLCVCEWTCYHGGGIRQLWGDISQVWGGSSTNYGGAISQVWGGSSTNYGGGISQVWGGHQPTMGGAISQLWGGSYFPTSMYRKSKSTELLQQHIRPAFCKQNGRTNKSRQKNYSTNHPSFIRKFWVISAVVLEWSFLVSTQLTVSSKLGKYYCIVLWFSSQVSVNSNVLWIMMKLWSLLMQ